MEEFVIYQGTKAVVTIYNTKLSKRYTLKKSIPLLVENYDDKIILLSHKEGYGGCCGKGMTKRPIMSDLTYCKVHNLNLQEFRNKWIEYYE